jgi:hypothetical protein
MLVQGPVECLRSRYAESSPLRRLTVQQAFATQLGALYQGDCLELLAETEDERFDLDFADPHSTWARTTAKELATR